MGAKFSLKHFILTKPPFPPKNANILDVRFWQNNPPTLVLSRPILANRPRNPEFGRHMCKAPYIKGVKIPFLNFGRVPNVPSSLRISVKMNFHVIVYTGDEDFSK